MIPYRKREYTSEELEANTKYHKELWAETERQKAARIKNARPMTKIETTVQTYRIYATLSCGHRTTFTISHRIYPKGDWRKRKIGCDQCFPSPAFKQAHQR